MKEIKVCEICGREMNLKENFYYSRNLQKYPDGYLNICKKCIVYDKNIFNPLDYLSVLKEVDIPYVKTEMDYCIDKYAYRVSANQAFQGAIGHYISKMSLKSFRNYHYIDTMFFELEAMRKRLALQEAREAGY